MGDRVRYSGQLSSMLKAAVGRCIGSKQASPLVVSDIVCLLAAGARRLMEIAFSTALADLMQLCI